VTINSQYSWCSSSWQYINSQQRWCCTSSVFRIILTNKLMVTKDANIIQTDLPFCNSIHSISHCCTNHISLAHQLANLANSYSSQQIVF